VELKTDSNSFKTEQYNNYLRIVQNIENNSAIVLYNFLASLTHEKFKYYKNNIIDKCFDNKNWAKIFKCEILYIAPKNIKERKWGQNNRSIIDNSINFLHFSDFPENIDTQFPNEWKIIKKGLEVLDNN
jgi:hypothetical protein